MRALDRLAQLHLVAQQHDVLRAGADGGEVGHGHLAGLVHEQVVELLVGAGVGEQPRGAAHQLPVRVQRALGVVHVQDQLAVEVTALVQRGRLLAGPHLLLSVLDQYFLDGLEQVVDGLVAVGRDSHALAVRQQRGDTCEPVYVLPAPGGPWMNR